MPHVVIEGEVSIEALFEKLPAIEERDGPDVRKTVDTFLNRRRDALLLESIVVEHGRRQKFLIAVTSKGTGATVRLLPLTDPEKTEGVKRLMSDVARAIRACVPCTRWGKTNLEEYLAD